MFNVAQGVDFLAVTRGPVGSCSSADKVRNKISGGRRPITALQGRLSGTDMEIVEAWMQHCIIILHPRQTVVTRDCRFPQLKKVKLSSSACYRN